MKRTILFCLLCLGFAACRVPLPENEQFEKRSTAAEIRQHIVGEWTTTNRRDYRIIIAADGRLLTVLTNGTEELMGTWELRETALRVTPAAARFEAARAAGVHLNEWESFPVIYVDEHELVLASGFSVAGSWRLTR